MPQTSENPRKMKKMSRVIWSYFGNKLLNPEVQFIASRSINTPPCDQGCFSFLLKNRGRGNFLKSIVITAVQGLIWERCSSVCFKFLNNQASTTLGHNGGYWSTGWQWIELLDLRVCYQDKTKLLLTFFSFYEGFLKFEAFCWSQIRFSSKY